MSEQLRVAILVLILLATAGCGAPDAGTMEARSEGDVLVEANPDGGLSRVRGRGLRMDTFVEITAYVPMAEMERGVKAVTAAFRAMGDVEAMASRYVPTSELSRLNAAASTAPVTVSPALWEILTMVRRENRRLDGRFDPTVGRLLDLWGFGAAEPRVPSDEEIEKARATAGLDGVSFDAAGRCIRFTRAGTLLDLGGTAKGSAIDAGAAVLRRAGVTAGLVNAGGDMVAFGTKPGKRPWSIGLQDPDDPERLLGIFPLADGEAVATSGDYERYFEVDGTRYHHLLDPTTGRPGRGSRSATIVASSAALADLEATALFLEGAGALVRLEKEGRAAMVVDPDGTWHGTSAFRKRFEERR